MSKKASISEWIQRAYRDEEGCPPPEAYLAQELEALDADARERLESHAETCAACGSERDLARAFDSPELASTGYREENGDRIARRLERRPPHGARGGWLGWLPSWGAVLQRPALQLAAAAVLVIGVGIGIRNAATPPPLIGGPGESATRSSVLEIAAPQGEIAALPTELSWKPVEGTSKYVVTVRAVDDSELWSQETTTASAAVDESLARQLQPAVWYVWSVEALDATGSRLAWSPAARFRISP